MTHRLSAAFVVALILSCAGATASAQAQCQVPAQLGVVFVVDDSGSMAGSDPGGLRAGGVAAGLRQVGVGKVGAVVHFASTARVVVGPSVLDAAAIDAISAKSRGDLKSTGGTDFDAAFTAAKAQLDAMPATVDRKAVVFLSDGGDAGFTTDGPIAAAGIPIHTVGFGQRSADARLAAISQRSGGIAQSVASAAEVQGAMARVVAASSCARVDGGQTFDLPPGGTRDVDFAVPAGTASFEALAAWGAGSVTARLVRPDGSILGPGTFRPGEALEEQPTFARAAAQAPAAGGWKVRLKAENTNAESIRVTVDLFGAAAAERPLTAKPAPARPGCETEVFVAGRQAWSRCFERDGNGWKTGFPLRVNGLDVAPSRGTTARLTGDGRLLANSARLFVTTSGALLPDGELTLRRGEISLNLRSQFLLPLGTESDVSIGGLPLQRSAGAEVGWTPSGASFKVALGLGRDFLSLINPNRAVDQPPGTGGQTLRRGFGLEVELATDNANGLSVQRVGGTIEAGRLFGTVGVQSLGLSWSAESNVWTGSATVVPFDGPLARYALPTISATVGVTGSPLGFASLEVTVADINKPVGPFVFLQKLGGSITKEPPPFTIGGTAAFSAGPSLDVPLLGKLTALEIDGAASYSYPATFKANAGVKLLRQPVSSAEIEVDFADASGSFAGETGFDFGGNGLQGRLEGWLRSGDFQVYGDVGLKVFGKTVSGGDGFVSSKGVGACRRGFGPDFGWRVEYSRGFPGGLKAMGSSCDFGDLTFPAQPAQAGRRGFTVRRATNGQLVRIRGIGGQPAVALIGPGGQRLEVPLNVPVSEGRLLTFVRDEPSNDVWVVLPNPAPGGWRVEPLPGSAAISPLGLSRTLPQPRLQTRLRRAGNGRYALRWSVRRNPGQIVRIVERGPDGLSRVLLRSRGTRGTLRFRPSTGNAGRRFVEATVEQNGTPRTVRSAGAFRVGTVRPQRPGRVRVRRGRQGLVTVSWRSVRGTRGYQVTARLRDGRRISQVLTANRRSLRLFGVARATSGTVDVRSISTRSIRSLPRRATLRRAR